MKGLKMRQIKIELPERLFLDLSSLVLGGTYSHYRNSLHGGNKASKIHVELMKQYIPQRFQYRIGDQVALRDGRSVKITNYCFISDDEAYWITPSEGKGEEAIDVSCILVKEIS